jgi:hypothetical protein
VSNEATIRHVPVVVKGQITVGHEHVIAGEPAPGTNPHWPKADRGEPFEKSVGEDVAGSGRKEDSLGKIPAPNGVFFDAWSQQVHGGPDAELEVSRSG